MEQSIKEALSGELPVVTTEYLEDLTKQMVNVFFNEVAIKMRVIGLKLHQRLLP